VNIVRPQIDTLRAWRKFKSAAMMGATVMATLLTLVPLFLVLGYLLKQGAASIDWAFFTRLPRPVGETGGGMGNAVVGTLELVGLASLLAVTLGVGTGLYLSEPGRNSAGANAVRFAADVLMGVPSIVVGIFIYAVVVRPMGGFSALAGAMALAVMMTPLVARTTEEAIRLVPAELRESALALGIPRWRTSLSVVARTAARAIITGVLLALARVAGETAPLLFTAFGNQYWSTSLKQPIAALTVQVYTYAISPFEDWHRQAWAGALVLTAMVLLVEAVVRLLSGRSLRVPR
jgi:phosphate transport system permease protein